MSIDGSDGDGPGRIIVDNYPALFRCHDCGGLFRPDQNHSHALSAKSAPRGEWRTIDSAPKDGTSILLFCPGEGGINVGHWSESLWVDQGGAWIIYEARSDTIVLNPSHWQSLPPPPSDEGSER